MAEQDLPAETNNKACWLVDMGYVVGAATSFKLDYVKAEDFLVGRYSSVQTFLFNGYDANYGINPGLRAFYNAMKVHGMQVRIYPMRPGAPGDNRQRGVDVDIGVHMVWQAGLESVEAVVVTSGDRDLIPAVEMVREKYNKHVMLFTYRRSVSQDLIAIANEWICFEDHEIELARHR